METAADPYQVLGVAPGATAKEIASAYRRLARQYHPDAPGGGDPERFRAVTEAFGELSDPTRRALFESPKVVADGVEVEWSWDDMEDNQPEDDFVPDTSLGQAEPVTVTKRRWWSR